MLEHGADLSGELRAALATLLEAVADLALRVLLARLGADARQVIDPATMNATVRAGDATGPHDAFKILESLGFVVEVGGRKNRHGVLRFVGAFMPQPRGFVKCIIASEIEEAFESPLELLDSAKR